MPAREKVQARAAVEPEQPATMLRVALMTGAPWHFCGKLYRPSPPGYAPAEYEVPFCHGVRVAIRNGWLVPLDEVDVDDDQRWGCADAQ